MPKIQQKPSLEIQAILDMIDEGRYGDAFAFLEDIIDHG